jgi:hypothetical protein
LYPKSSFDREFVEFEGEVDNRLGTFAFWY